MCTITIPSAARWRLLVPLLLAAFAPAAAEAADEALLAALRGGGHNLYFRHAATDWTQVDLARTDSDPASCDPGQMRQLSAAGREAAQRAGAVIARLEIPVAAAYASRYCRARETAQGLYAGTVVITDDLMNLRTADLAGGREAVISRARARLSTPPPPGQNHLFVAHGNLARAATGLYPAEGEGLVFRPTGDGFEFVGRFDPARIGTR